LAAISAAISLMPMALLASRAQSSVTEHQKIRIRAMQSGGTHSLRRFSRNEPAAWLRGKTGSYSASPEMLSVVHYGMTTIAERD
jgi:hypothetical protein